MIEIKSWMVISSLMTGTHSSAASSPSRKALFVGRVRGRGLSCRDTKQGKLLVHLSRCALRTLDRRDGICRRYQRFKFRLTFSTNKLIQRHCEILLPKRYCSWAAFLQSARNFSKPISVKGCLRSCRTTAIGNVATSAPIFAASRKCNGFRTLATRTSVEKS